MTDSNEAKPLTFDPADSMHYVHHLADPRMLGDSVDDGLRRIVRSVKQASGGIHQAYIAMQRFAQLINASVIGPSEIDRSVEDVDRWWEEEGPADDLRDLAKEQAKKYRDIIFDMEMDASVIPAKLNAFKSTYGPLVGELVAWADKPRRDALEQYEEELEREAWPKPVAYPDKNGYKNADIFLAARPFRCISFNEIAYTFKDGIWQHTDDQQLASEISKTDRVSALDVSHVNKAVTAIHHRRHTDAEPFGWIKPRRGDPDPSDIVLFGNGLLDTTAMRLFANDDGRYFATGKPDHDWDPFAECPLWKAWLEETVDPAYHDTLQEWFGYCLVPDVSAHRFMLFLGGPRSGKSTALGILRQLVGDQHAGSTNMNDLAGDFGVQGMIDKRLVIIPDAHDARVSNRNATLERLKSITGGDQVSVNRKHKDPINTVLSARLAISANRLPSFIDESGALAARMLLVRFNKCFIGKEDRALPEALSGELSGIANWALEGLHRLRQNGMQFTVSDEGKIEADVAARSQSPARRFAEECLTVTGNETDFTSLKEIHDVYEYWVQEGGAGRHEFRSQTDLASDLIAAVGGGIKQRQRRVNKKQVWGLVGVARARAPVGAEEDDK